MVGFIVGFENMVGSKNMMGFIMGFGCIVGFIVGFENMVSFIVDFVCMVGFDSIVEFDFVIFEILNFCPPGKLTIEPTLAPKNNLKFGNCILLIFLQNDDILRNVSYNCTLGNGLLSINLVVNFESMVSFKGIVSFDFVIFEILNFWSPGKFTIVPTLAPKNNLKSGNCILLIFLQNDDILNDDISGNDILRNVSYNCILGDGLLSINLVVSFEGIVDFDFVIFEILNFWPPGKFTIVPTLASKNNLKLNFDSEGDGLLGNDVILGNDGISGDDLKFERVKLDCIANTMLKLIAKSKSCFNIFSLIICLFLKYSSSKSF